MTNENADLIFVLNKKAEWDKIIGPCIFLFAWPFMLGILVYGIIGNPDKVDNFILFAIIIFSLAWIYMLKIFLWHIRGRERISFNNETFIVEKLGTILTYPRKFDTIEIEDFSISTKPYAPYWIKTNGLNGGNIQFYYQDQIKYFGQSVSILEGIQIVDKLNKRLKPVRSF